SVDDDGDNGQTQGAGAYVLLHATSFPRLGFKDTLSEFDVRNDDFGKAPRFTTVHSYRIFRLGVPYAQGGVPITDAERLDALADTSKRAVAFPDPESPGSYRALFSVGPYVSLPPDSAIELDVAFCVGAADYSARVRHTLPVSPLDADAFHLRFGS